MVFLRFNGVWSLALAAAAFAGVAEAQTPAPPTLPAGGLSPIVEAQQTSTAAKLSSAVFAPGVGEEAAAPAISLSPTAIDHSFSSQGLVASAGFLCGLKSAPDNNGAASALGYDPHGRFVGARLSYAFR